MGKQSKRQVEDLYAATMCSMEDKEISLKLVEGKWRCESVSFSKNSAKLLLDLYDLTCKMKKNFLTFLWGGVRSLAGCRSSHRINSFKKYSGIMALAGNQVNKISVSSYFDSMLIRRHETFKGGEGTTMLVLFPFPLCFPALSF